MSFLLFSILGGLVYGTLLENPYLFDDSLVIARNHWLQWEMVPGYFRSFFPEPNLMVSGYRPLLMATYAAQVELLGRNPLWLRGANLLLHAGCAVLLLHLARRVLPTGKGNSRWLGWGAAAFFFLHPIQNNVITLVWKRSDLLVGLGLLGALLCFRSFARSRRSGWGALLGGLMSLAAASFSKESALIFPAVWALTDLAFSDRDPALRKRMAAVYAGVAAVALAQAWVIFVRMPSVLALHQFQSENGAPPSLRFDRWTYLLTQSSAFLEYLRLLVWPFAQAVYHPVHVVRGLTDPYLWMGGGVVLILLMLAAVLWKNHRPAAFGILLFFIFLVPSSSFIPLNLLMDEDRLYLPIAGLAITLEYAARAWINRLASPKAARATAAGLLAVAIIVSFAQNYRMSRVWRNPITLWLHNVQIEPEDVRAWTNLGQAFSAARMYARARTAFAEALRLDPEDVLPMGEMGLVAMEEGDFAESEAWLQRAFQQGEGRWQTLLQLGGLEVRRKNPAEAARYFMISAAVHRTFVPPVRNLANLLLETGSPDLALPVLREAIARDARDPETQYRLAEYFWRIRKDRDAASFFLRRSLEVRPDDADAKTLEVEIGPRG